jgi:hypothetical protein
MHYLAIQVGKFGFPAVTDPKRSDTGSGEVDSNGTAQAPCACNKDCGLLNLFLTVFTPSREDDLPLETFLVVGGQWGANGFFHVTLSLGLEWFGAIRIPLPLE